MSLRVELKVVPSSGRLACVLDKQERLKCFLKAPAEHGKANIELVKFLAKQCGLKQREIHVVAGVTSRNKIIKIDADMTYEQFLGACDIVIQKKLF